MTGKSTQIIESKIAAQPECVPSTDALDENLFTLFERQARRRPEATAVIDRFGDVLSYRALQARAEEIAAYLRGKGVGAETQVGVLMHQSTDLVATLLGVLKSGCCYVPLEPDDPIHRTRRMIATADCMHVLGNQDLLEKLATELSQPDEKSNHLEMVDVEEIGPIEGESEHGSGLTAAGGRQLAYILFTSGTTGQPKGVEVEHRAVINLLIAVNELLGIRDTDRFLATSSVGFDTSVGEIFLPLICGASVVIHDRRLVLDPGHFTDEIRHHGVTVIHTGPSVWTFLLDKINDFPRIRIAMSSSEAMRHDLGRQLIRVADHVWNLYGPTETIVWATAQKVERNVIEEDKSGSPAVSIGLPLKNADVIVLDEQQEIVPSGQKGELWIGGEFVARGYRKNHDLTAERFRDLHADGHRFYRSGDLVTIDVRGVLHFFGRTDDQINVRGMRIEPMEVESAILSHSQVQKVAATWFENASGSRSLVAGIVCKSGIQVDKQELHEYLEELLPTAMVPSRFVFLEELPLTKNGKADRKAIRDLATGDESANAPASSNKPESSNKEVRLTDESSDQRFASTTERRLAEIWEKTLGVSNVERTDHFFSVGGDSLSAVMVILRVEELFDITMSVKILFESPTLCGLAERIDEIRVRPDHSGESKFIFPLTETGSGTPMFFCSADLKLAKKGLWTVDAPLYSISLWAQGAGFVKAKSIEELTRSHIENIKAIQPVGPYRIAGYSFGGMIAIEIARQLQAAGEEIELLFLLDPSEPFRTAGTPDRNAGAPVSTGAYESRGAWMKRHILNIVRRPLDIVSYVGERRSRFPLWPWLCYQLVHLHGRNANTVSTHLLPKDRWPAFWYALRSLGKSYVVRPYQGRVCVVFTGKGALCDLWIPLLGPDAEVAIVESSHLSLFDQPVLSEWLHVLKQSLGEMK